MKTISAKIGSILEFFSCHDSRTFEDSKAPPRLLRQPVLNKENLCRPWDNHHGLRHGLFAFHIFYPVRLLNIFSPDATPLTPYPLRFFLFWRQLILVQAFGPLSPCHPTKDFPTLWTA